MSVMTPPDDWDRCERYARMILSMSDDEMKMVLREVMPEHIIDQVNAARDDNMRRLRNATQDDKNTFTEGGLTRDGVVWKMTHVTRILVGLGNGKTKKCQHIKIDAPGIWAARVDVPWMACLDCVEKFERYFPATKRQNFTCDRCWEHHPGDVDLKILPHGGLTLFTGLCTPCARELTTSNDK